MSGHNKWAQIKRQKAVTDAKRSKIFTKLVKLIATEAKLSKGDVGAPGLRAAIDKAKAANMPLENIERAIKKASEPSQALESITYEAYGPGGAGLIIEVLTDSRNRAAQEIKHILSRNGYALGGIGSVSWGFTRDKSSATWTPTMLTPLNDEDAAALDALIDEIDEHDDVQDVFTNAE